MSVHIEVPDELRDRLRSLGQFSDDGWQWSAILIAFDNLITEAAARAEVQKQSVDELVSKGPYCGDCGHQLSNGDGHYPSCWLWRRVVPCTFDWCDLPHDHLHVFQREVGGHMTTTLRTTDKPERKPTP